MAKTVRLHQFSGGHFQLKEIPVVHEHPLSVYVNGQELVTLLCTPTKLEALVIGFLAFEGVIHSLDDVQGLTILDGGEYADVRLASEFVPPRRRIHTSGCGGGITFSLETHMSAALEDDSTIDPRSLFPLVRELYLEAHSYRESRGIHAAALAEGEKLLIVTEDVGRHNAIDKICGEAMLRRIPATGKVLLATGRISSEMLRKAAHLGTPIVVSRTSATTLSIELAKRLGLTLIGYVRGDSFYVYSHPERLVVSRPAPALLPPPLHPATASERK
jgi:FdhD protein